MKKRFLYLAVPALFASLTLSACNEDPTHNNNNNNNPTVEKYTFTFELDAPEEIKDDIKYTLSNGNGEYNKGTTIAVNISSYDSVNYSFDGYFVNNSKVTTETSYKFLLQADTTLVAKFSAKSGEEKPDPTPDPDPDPTPEPDPTPDPDNPSFNEVEIGDVVETGKLGLRQQTNGEAIYFDGEMDEKNTFYFGTTTDFASAPNIKAVKVSETELTLEITSGTNAGKYISAKNALGTDGKLHNNILIENKAFNWTYNATYDAYTAKLTDSDEVFIGNYNNYSTISLSDIEKIEGNGNNIAHIVQNEITEGGEVKPGPTPDPDPDPTPEPDNPSFDEVEIDEVVETGKLGLWQQTNGEAIYFDGEMDEKNIYYFGTTTDFASAPDIKAVKVSETELTLEITSGTNAGKYISAKNAVGSDGKPHNNILIESTAFNWTYNATYDAYSAKLTDSDEVFIGNYGNYSTISLSDVKYFEGSGNNIAHIVQNEITGQTSGGGSISGGQSENPVGDKSISLPSGDKTLKTNYKAISADEYYKNIDFNDKSTLEQNLLTLTQKNFDQIHYDEARRILQYTDASLEDESKIYGVYDGQLVNAHWDANNNWNREHLWPASRLPNGRSDTKEGADLFNLRASYYRTNGSRGNKYYSENGDGGFYPIIDGNTDSDQRGDSARAIFYMAFKYGNIGLEVVENPKGNVGYDDHYYKMGILSTLIEWNKADPVDEFEMRRNERIYEFQGNRNPFVDYPYLVDLFF